MSSSLPASTSSSSSSSSTVGMNHTSAEKNQNSCNDYYPKRVTLNSQLPSIQGLIRKAQELFHQIYSTNDSSTNYQYYYCTVAPGRVNLIGEHVDYTGGFVLPFAIEYSTVVYGYVRIHNNNNNNNNNNSSSDKNRLRFVSDRNPTDHVCIENFTLEDVIHGWKPQDSSSDKKWTNYIIGTVKEYIPILLTTNTNNNISVDITFAITSNVPLGSGLSSSASLLVSIATFMECALVSTSQQQQQQLNHNNLLLDAAYPSTTKDSKSYDILRALKCQQVEFHFCSTPCGIMDQFVSSAAQLQTLLLIDCESQTFTPVQPPPPPPLHDPTQEDICFVICNSHVKHDNVNGEYPIRVRQCQEALDIIQKKCMATNMLEIPTSLRHVTLQHLNLFTNEDNEESFQSSILYNRVRHVVTENQRVLDCTKALEKGDWKTVGELMISSHESMKGDYEVSCTEIDSLVEWAKVHPGVYGSRLTGGGFGGCTVTLCHNRHHASTLISTLQTKFQTTYGIQCTCFITMPQDGARRVLLE
jgi:galactokinase